MKTFLELTNEVGKNLRRSLGTTYTALDTDADQVFMQQMINEAKRMVEAEEQWSVLRNTVEFNTVAATETYDLGDAAVLSSGSVANDRSALVQAKNGAILAWDVTSGDEFRMCRRTRDWVENESALLQNSNSTKQLDFTIYTNGSPNYGVTVAFPYEMTTVRTIRMVLYTPQVELALAADVVVAPWRPIVLAATALAAEERGEELGLNASTWWERYNSSLSEALVVDGWVDEDQILLPS